MVCFVWFRMLQSKQDVDPHRANRMLQSKQLWSRLIYSASSRSYEIHIRDHIFFQSLPRVLARHRFILVGATVVYLAAWRSLLGRTVGHRFFWWENIFNWKLPPCDTRKVYVLPSFVSTCRIWMAIGCFFLVSGSCIAQKSMCFLATSTISLICAHIFYSYI